MLLCTFSRICLAAFGFLPGKEVKNAKIGNLGLQDREFKLANLRTGRDTHPLERTSRLEMGPKIYLSIRR
jgi:hypothetical protein